MTEAEVLQRITDVDEELIEQATTFRVKKRKKRKFFCLLRLLFYYLWLLFLCGFITGIKWSLMKMEKSIFIR